MAFTREIPNQLISGKDVSEGDLYRGMKHYLEMAEQCARGLALNRKDLRWLHIASLLEQMKTNAHIMMNLRKQMKAPPRIIQ